MKKEGRQKKISIFLLVYTVACDEATSETRDGAKSNTYEI